MHFDFNFPHLTYSQSIMLLYSFFAVFTNNDYSFDNSNIFVNYSPYTIVNFTNIPHFYRSHFYRYFCKKINYHSLHHLYSLQLL